MADYSISAVTRRAVATGSVGLGPYSFTFEILTQTDITVYLNSTQLTLTTDYTVTINANGTGSVTLVLGGNISTTPTASDRITIIGARDIERTTDFVTAGDLTASSLNEQLDSLVIFDQQISERVDRALIGSISDPTSLDMTLPSVDNRKGRYLAFNATTGAPEAGPGTADAATLASISGDIATLADIEDGTDATDAIQTVAGISSNVTTVAGISSSVTSVASNTSNISTVAGLSSELAAVGAISSDVTAVSGIASDVTAVAADATDIGVVATNISNVNAVGSISANVTTVAGISSDVTAVAADSTDIGVVSANISNVNAVGAVSGAVTTVAGIASAVSTVSGISSDVSTVASNVTDVTNFADVYYGPSLTDPTLRKDGSSLQSGDLYFNTGSTDVKVYTGSSWQAAYASLAGAILDSDFTVNGLMSRTGAGVYTVITDNSSNWNTAYGWGDHSAAGYATTSQIANSSNWDTAYGWGDHSTQGYATTAATVAKTAATGSGALPSGTTAQRDGSPSAGYIRFNSDLTSFEGYNGSAWGSIGGGASGGGSDGVFYENDQTVTANYTISSNKNAMSTGPITIDSGVTVTIPTGSRWVVI